jgi:tetratricopeptide (TPR) repeat protein
MKSPTSHDLFVSYAHKDNDHGQVTALIEAIKREYTAFTKEPLREFFDDRDIKDGADWEARIATALAESKVLLAVLSPEYFTSKWCRKEFERFRDIEYARLFPGEPIQSIYIAVHPDFEHEPDDLVDEWLKHLRRTQSSSIEAHRWWPEGREALERDHVRERLHRLMDQVHKRIAPIARVDLAPHNFTRWAPQFTGRTEQLRQLHDYLVWHQLCAITAIQGTAGVGKSTLAVEYGHRFRTFYPGGRFLVNCADIRAPEQLGLALAEIAQAYLGLVLSDDLRRDPKRQILHMRSSFLERANAPEGGRILVILDNVSHPAILNAAERDAVLPSKEKVSFVITTSELPDRLGGIDTLPLDQLSIDEGQQLLFRFRPIETNDPQDIEWKSARSIATEFGGHAWALEIAGAYLRQNRSIPFEAYHDGLKKKGVSVKLDQAGRWAKDAGSIHHNEKFLADLMGPTLAQLDLTDRRVLEYAAWLPPDQICLPWLRDLAEQDFPGSFKHDPDDPDPWSDGVVRRLFGWRLLTSAGEDARFVRIHRLTQEVLRKLDEGAQRFDRVMSHAGSRANWLATHWHLRDQQWELVPLVQSATLWLDDGNEAASFANVVAYSSNCLGNLHEARRLFFRAIEIKEKAYEPDHPNLATLYSNLAMVEQDLGNLTVARRLLLRAIEIREKAYDSDHPALANIYSNLGMVERGLRNLPEARRLLLRAIEIQEKAYEPDHPNLARSYSNLASVEQDLGNLPEARRLLFRAIEIEEKAYEPDHPALADRYLSLAVLEMDRGNSNEAIRLMRKAHSIWHKRLGDNYEMTGLAHRWLIANDPEFEG